VARRARESAHFPVKIFSSHLVPLGCGPCVRRTGHPFAASGPRGPSQKIELVFSASPKTVSGEPEESFDFHRSLGQGGTWQSARFTILRFSFRCGFYAAMPANSDLWGRESVFAILGWSETHNGAMSDTCRESLRSHLSSVMEWVEEGPERSFPVLIAIARVVAPFSSKISQRDTSVWLRTSRHLRTHGTDSDRTYVSVFLLALALNDAPPAPLELVAESFEYVHQAAWDQRLSDSAWIVVEPFVPELSWISNWDKCERLRRGLISAFLRNSWPASELQKRIKNPDLLEQVLRSARRVDGGERLLRAF